MSTKRIILISGYARSGKDSLANALEKHLDHMDPVRVKFANELKTALGVALVSNLGLMNVDVFTEDEAEKQAIRPLLVEFGKFARSVDRDVFVKAAWDTICDLFENGKDVAIVPDLRYVNEFNLISQWAREQEWAVTHLRICRMGNEAANEEELHSICSLPQADATRIFIDGDLEGIERWAKELCSKPSMPVPMPTIPVGGMNLGGPIDPAKVAAYAQPNKGTEAWLKTSTTASVPEHLTGKIVVPDNELLEQVLNIRLALERMDARLKRLEAKNEPNF